MPVYAAFLRGINVGGKRVVKMAALRALCQQLGLADVRTYIQSGNIVFSSAEEEAALRPKLEDALETVFGFAIPVTLRPADELVSLLARFPFGEAQRNAASEATDAETEYVYLWQEPPSDGALRKALDGYDGADLCALHGRSLYLLCSVSIRDSKLAARIGKAFPPATARNLRTLGEVARMAQGDVAKAKGEGHRMKRYDKLVRDHIPEIVRQGGSIPHTRVLDEPAYFAALNNKLQEEVAEYLDGFIADELADIMEVVYAIGQHLGLSAKELEYMREEKRAQRGGFERRIFLESVE